MTSSYETILRQLASLNRSTSQLQREVVWVTDAAVVGVSRTPRGEVEIFLTGPELVTSSSTVRRTIEHQVWHRAGDPSSISASRLLLPAAGHFDQVAAFICAELTRCNADDDLQRAFSSVEPLIELAISRLRIADEYIVGLIGELLLLESVMKVADDAAVGLWLGRWNGWQESLRDFSTGSAGIEVKTTMMDRSSHQVRGLHQVEITPASALEEEHLFLVSISLAWADRDANSARTLPSLVESIVERAASSTSNVIEEKIAEFIAHVRAYGAGSGVGYDHASMSDAPSFNRSFVTRFARCYDMLDDNVQILRTAGLQSYSHVDLASLSFRIELPAHVRGELNPVVGLNHVAQHLARARH